MCGILGAFSRQTPTQDWFEPAFREALELVKHRGPDGSGYWDTGKQPLFVAFGHRRLSIIDLSTDASQPFANDQGLVTIFNGEIYNYIELRQELQAQGYKFSTSSDTEVILRAYEAWGTRCFERFNGMWAIAIWDAKAEKLILSRDRMGVKPLYYTIIGETLFFGSEIKQLLGLHKRAGQKPGWNVYRLYEFLAHVKLHHAEETLYEGIYQFKPGCFAELDSKTSVSVERLRSQMKRYWDFPAEEEFLNNMSFEDAAAELRRLLESAVMLRLRSDVPVGSALSGGLDSSAIVSIIARLNPQKQKTFSATFKGQPIDERRYAEMVIKDTPIEGVFVEPTADSLVKALPDLIRYQDGPFPTTSMYAQLEVFKAASAHGVTVMLDGQGADEIFGGYEGFFKAYLQSVKKSRGAVAAAIEGTLFVKNHPRYFTLQRARRKFSSKFDWLSVFSDKAKTQIKARQEEYSRSGDPYLLGGSVRRYSDPLREALYCATVCTSLPSLLAFEDRNSMAFSVESRTPFLDYRIVEFAFKCPPAFHMRHGMRKALLREAIKGLVPEAIRMRKDKLGFVTPEEDWRQSYLASLKAAALGSVNDAVFDRSSIERAIETPGQWRVLSTLLS